MRTLSLAVLLLIGCASEVKDYSITITDASVDAQADTGTTPSAISVTVTQCANGQCHRLTVDDTCHCASGKPATWVCEQCKDGACAMAIPNTTCPAGCNDCFTTCHSIYLSSASMPYDFQFSYTCE